MLDRDVRRQLREVAEAATEAEVWRKLDEGCTLMLVKGGQSLGVVTLSELLHLHSADPATVLSLLDALDEADEKRDCWRATAEEAQEAAGEWLAAAEETLAERTRLAETLAVAVEAIGGARLALRLVADDSTLDGHRAAYTAQAADVEMVAALARIDTLTASQGEPT